MRNLRLWLFLLMIAVLGTSGGLFYYVCKAHTFNVSVGESCLSKPGFPPSTCTQKDLCTTLKDYKNISDKVEGCGFSSPYGKDLICCPNEIPGPKIATTIKPEITTQKPKLYYDYLGTIGHLIPVTLDGREYRHTAILLSPSLLLSTKLSNDSIPQTVLLGTGDPTIGVDSEVINELKPSKSLDNDLILLEMEVPISESQLLANISIAKLCNSGDIANSSYLDAIGFGRDRKLGRSCAVFTKRVHSVAFDQCRHVTSSLDKQFMPKPYSHLCVEPGVDHEEGDCQKCLTGSTSVLRVVRPDGSFCVGGIATPTTSECFVSGEPLYYTVLLSNLLDLL